MGVKRHLFPPVRSLSAKLVALSILLGTLPAGVFAWLSLSASQRVLEETIGQRLADVAEDTVSHMTDLIVRERKRMRGWAHQDVMDDIPLQDRSGRIAQFFMNQKDSDPAYVEIECFDPSGLSVATLAGRPPGSSVLDPRAMRAALRGKELVRRVGDSIDDTTLIDITVPITDPSQPDRIRGILHARYDWERGQAPAARIQQTYADLGLMLDVMVLDRDGVVVAEGAPAEGRGLLHKNLRREGWRAAAETSRPGLVRYLRDEGIGSLVGLATMRSPHARWTVLVTQPLRRAFAPVAQLQRRILLILVGVQLTALGVALYLSDRMARPLRALTAAIREMATLPGTPKLVSVDAQDEIGELAEAFNDMSLRLSRAQEELINAAKFAFIGEVAAGIAHEIRTPLGILRTSAQILGRSLRSDDRNSAELLETIVEEVDRLARVVEGLLQIARPHQPQIEPTQLHELLSRACEFLQGQADESGIVLRREFSGAQPPAACDPEQIYQVVLNLVVNALQVLPKHSAPPAEIAIRTREPHDGFVGFEVSDNGPGIPPELHERVFTPYFTMREGGTGLGLALVQRVVQAHKGSVEMTSRPGVGTTFRIELPVARRV